MLDLSANHIFLYIVSHSLRTNSADWTKIFLESDLIYLLIF